MARGSVTTLRPGMRFGILTTIQYAGRSGKENRLTWICKCKCGNEKQVFERDLKKGKNKSCGCMAGKRTHGGTNLPEYVIWTAIKNRCYYKGNDRYHRYGGRGIKVCNRWLNFAHFYEDMGSRPSKKHSVDRIDNDGDYESTNCRWATGSEQQRNRSDSFMLTYDGKTMSIWDWADELQVDREMLRYRKRRGWSDKDTIEHILKRQTKS